MSREMSGGAVAGWSSVSANQKLESVSPHERQNADRYKGMLSQALLPLIHAHNADVIFQQENASICTAKSMKTNLQQQCCRNGLASRTRWYKPG